MEQVGIEEATIRAFMRKERRERWVAGLASAKRRPRMLDKLNHTDDIDEKHATVLPGGADIESELRRRGAGEICHVISDNADLDGRDLSLGEALRKMEEGTWGTLICCVPGRLAYYMSESGVTRLLLYRPER